MCRSTRRACAGRARNLSRAAVTQQNPSCLAARQRGATRRICCKRISGFCESIIDDEQLGAAIAQGIRVFLDTPADVEGYDHGARPTGGQVALDVTILVEHEDRNPIAAAEGMGAQRPCKPRHAVPDLLPRAATAPEDRGVAGARALRGPHYATRH